MGPLGPLLRDCSACPCGSPEAFLCLATHCCDALPMGPMPGCWPPSSDGGWPTQCATRCRTSVGAGHLPAYATLSQGPGGPMCQWRAMGGSQAPHVSDVRHGAFCLSHTRRYLEQGAGKPCAFLGRTHCDQIFRFPAISLRHCHDLVAILPRMIAWSAFGAAPVLSGVPNGPRCVVVVAARCPWVGVVMSVRCLPAWMHRSCRVGSP